MDKAAFRAFSTIEQKISNIESQLLSTRDRNEEKRLAGALQTALHGGENMDAEIVKRLYAKTGKFREAYSSFVDAIDCTPQR